MTRGKEVQDQWTSKRRRKGMLRWIRPYKDPQPRGRHRVCKRPGSSRRPGVGGGVGGLGRGQEHPGPIETAFVSGGGAYSLQVSTGPHGLRYVWEAECFSGTSGRRGAHKGQVRWSVTWAEGHAGQSGGIPGPRVSGQQCRPPRNKRRPTPW